MYAFKNGQTSIILRVKLLNSSVTTGAGLTGLTSASSGLIISTIADNESTATAYTVAGSNVETISTLGTFAAPTSGKARFKEVDSTNHPGLYEIQIADARWAVSSAKSLIVSISGATNLAQTDIHVPLQTLDPYDAVRAGLTALPNVASGNAGAVVTSGTGTAQLATSSGQVTTTSTANTAIATEILGTTVENNGTYTLKAVLRFLLAVIAGRTTVSGGTVTFKTPDNAKTRATYTTDSSNQRTAATLDATD